MKVFLYSGRFFAAAAVCAVFPAIVPGEPASSPQASGMVFDDNPAGDSSADTYVPDWSRFEKKGLFGVQEQPPPPSESVDLAAVESHYQALLGMDISSVQRRKTLLDMADLYHKYNVRQKEAAVYEKYIETFPQDRMVPELCMRLGFLYREIGAYKTALAKFYSVLNSTLAVNRSGMAVYRQLSLRAQMEIADTYFGMGQYDMAAKFYLRLKRIEMPSGDRVQVDFKYAYTQYLIKDYTTAISSFQNFIQTHPDDPLVAEAHFVLAGAYRQINQPQAALAEVLSLLQYQAKKGEDTATWTYWKRRTGNQLGNEFYEQGDYESALRIYQAMARLSDEPGWLWPSLFQMGLCLERLRLTTKAADAYDIILAGAQKAREAGTTLPQSLADIVDQVKWRREHLAWQESTDKSLNQILGQ
jgi:tetratricopeptide (TPR) repeat protein